jgi:hypothetical protein
VTFTLRLAPFQLHPDFSPTGTHKYTWYLTEKYHADAALMDKYVA